MTEPVYHWKDRHRRRQPGGNTPLLQPVTNSQPHQAYGAAALNNELQQLLATPEGQRNSRLNIAAFSLSQLVAAGHLDETSTRDQLRAAALHIGLSVSETDATLRSAFRAGTQQPRAVQSPSTISPQIVEISVNDLSAATNGATRAADGHDDTDRARTSWWPQPIAERAAAANEEPAPTHLIRDDGQPLLYSGKVNGFIGESESGKSWVALLAIVQAINAGQRVLILDFEDSPGSVNRRLTSLGCTPDQTALVDYANPDESLNVLQREDLTEALTHHHAVILADGVNAAMTLLGYDLNSNVDATAFFTAFLRPLAAATGACVITVDHVPKNPDARGKGGIGAQAKRSMQDGTCLLVEITEPFGKGQSGTVKLTVDKDRNGHVRGISAGGKYAGKAHIDSIGDQVRIHIEGPDPRPDGDTWRPTGLMEKVSRLLERAEQPLSGREIRDDTPGRAQTVGQAISELLIGGYITAERRTGRGGGDAYSSVKPFREDAVETPNHGSGSRLGTGSQLVPGTDSEVVPDPSPPYGEGTTSMTRRNHPEPELVPGTKTLNLPPDYSSCNRCGQDTEDAELDRFDGSCRQCSWANR